MKLKRVILPLNVLIATTFIGVSLAGCTSKANTTSAKESVTSEQLPSENGKADITGISLHDSEIIYNGESQSLAIDGTLPEGVSVAYEIKNSKGDVVNEAVNVDTYTVTAKFTDSTGKYNDLADMNATLTINKADINEIALNDSTVSYDGEVHSLTIAGTLPKGVSVSYEIKNSKGEAVEEAVNADTYTVTAKFTDSTGNYNSLDDLNATLKINKIDINDIEINDSVIAYDGESHLFGVKEELPEGVSVSYEIVNSKGDVVNEAVNVDTYTVTAKFIDSTGNYNIPSDIYFTMKIISLEDINLYLDETNQTATILTCKLTGDVDIPSNVIINDVLYDITAIATTAFSNNLGLKSVNIPESIKNIGSYAFYGCKNLTSVNISIGVEHIDANAFKDCVGLTSIIIPTSVTSIGSYAFDGCYRLVEVYNLSNVSVTQTSQNNLGANAKIIHSSLDQKSNLVKTNDSIYYVTDTTKIYVSPISFDVKTITLDDDCTSINKYAFNNCLNLVNVTLPKSITAIDIYAFSGCLRLTEIYNLSSLTITLGKDSNGYVGYYAKVVHKSLEEESNLKTINGGIYYVKDTEKIFISPVDLNVASIAIDSNTTAINSGAFYGCGGLKDVTLSDGVTSIGNNAFVHCTSLENIKLPNTIVSIGNYAFGGCTSLTSIAIPSGVTSIGDYSFSSCTSLVGVTLSSGLVSIGNSAFINCTSLSEITIPNTVTSIGNNAFSKCSSLKSIVIPSGVTKLGSNVFEGCSYLKSIEIPLSVTSIGTYALQNCSRLESIKFNGTKAEWEAITKGSYWNRYSGTYTIHCTDGDISK